MMLSYRTRRRLSLLVLLVGLPLYIIAAVTVMNWLDGKFGRQPIWIEAIVYIVLGFLWIVPCRPIFRGVGQPDPDAKEKERR
ncbi:MAG: DUF2842 domain-containing protein [Rhodobacteraceae bacterium]|nr:DUF2842 domain-containing protein [Paracoccaceae bacterium]